MRSQITTPHIHDGIKLFAWEFGGLWPLEFKGYADEKHTLGYRNKTHGPVPLSSEIEVRYSDDVEWKDVEKAACWLEKKGYRVLVIKGMPQSEEIGHG